MLVELRGEWEKGIFQAEKMACTKDWRLRMTMKVEELRKFRMTTV